MTSSSLRSRLRASRARIQTSAANSGIAYDWARAAEEICTRISGLATAAIHIGEPPRPRAARIAMASAPSRQAASAK